MAKQFGISIYEFQLSSDYINAIFESIKAARNLTSIRGLAKRLAINHSTLSRILGGERQVPREALPRFSEFLELTPSETAYFELISQCRESLSAKSFFLIKELLRNENQNELMKQVQE